MSHDIPSRAGTLGIHTDGTFRIHFDRTLHHSVVTVWRALTDPAKLDVWLPGCRIDARLGGAVHFDFGDEGAATGEVLSLRAPDEPGSAAQIEHTWRWEGLPDSAVLWRLEPTDGGCRLLLTHREVLPEPAVDFAVGWHAILDALELHAEGQPTDRAWESYGTLDAHYRQGSDDAAAQQS